MKSDDINFVVWVAAYVYIAIAIGMLAWGFYIVLNILYRVFHQTDAKRIANMASRCKKLGLSEPLCLNAAKQEAERLGYDCEEYRFSEWFAIKFGTSIWYRETITDVVKERFSTLKQLQ
jgi:hypothetical protein